MKNCATCKFINFRCKGECADCVHKVAEKTIPPSPAVTPHFAQGLIYPLGKMSEGQKGHAREGLGVYLGKEEVEEKCKCIECYDEDSGKYKYWEAEPELVKYFSKGGDM